MALGEALHYEFKGDGVDVTVLSPGPTNTAMKDMDGFDFSVMPLRWMDTQPVVKSGLKALGHRPSVIAGLMNRFMAWFGQHLGTRSLLAWAFGRMVRRGLASERFGARDDGNYPHANTSELGAGGTATRCKPHDLHTRAR